MTPPRIPQPVIEKTDRPTVRFFQDLVARVQRLEANGTVPRDAVFPTPAISGGSAAQVVGLIDTVSGTPVTVTEPDAAALSITSTTFHGDGATVAFVLPVGWDVITDPETLNISLDGIVQRTDEFTVAAGTLTFDVAPPFAPPAGDPNIFVKWIPDAVAVATLANANKAAINANSTVLTEVKSVTNKNAGLLDRLFTAYNALISALIRGGSIT